MNKSQLFYLIVCFLINSSTTIYGQKDNYIISNASLAEKIYLQLDKDIYTTGNTIWFKAIVTKSFDNAPFNLSGILYVELINSNKTIIEKKLIKINQGIGEGFFDVPETFPTGNYIIRAYTEWNKNFDSDFFFEKYIQVFSIENKKTTPNQDSLNQSQKDIIPEIISKSDITIDLQFLPESGDMVDGLPAKIGFKALNNFGTGIQVEGTIIDQDNTLITNFKSNSLGMGSFQLHNVDAKKIYAAKLNNDSKLYPLPKVSSSGNSISVSENNESIRVNTSSNYIKNDSIFLNVSFRGAVIHYLKAKLINSSLKFLFSSNELPEGIIVFKMMNLSKQVLAERIYFNKKLETNLKLKLSTDKSVYSKRELTNLSIKTVNSNNEPMHANTSVLVIDKQELGNMQNLRDNIVSYFLLSSELTGNIENPGYYFNNNETMKADLDALMLTQGWRHYKYVKPYNNLSYKAETSLTVSGKVIVKQPKNKSNQVDLTMVTYGKDEVLYMQPTDGLGSFKFDLDDEFGENVKILVSAKKLGKKVAVNFFIDEKKSPLVEFEHKILKKEVDSIHQIIVKKAIEKKKIEDNFFIPEGNIALDEVVVTGRKLTPIQQKVTDRFGEPDKIIDGKELQKKEEKWSSGIFDIIHFNFSDKLIIKTSNSGYKYAASLNNLPTLVVIDGIPVEINQYQNIQNIQADQVTSIELIEFAKSFASFCGQLIKDRCKNPGNIIAIYTKEGKGIYGAYTKKSKSLGEITIPVFAETREFYAPKYDKVIPENEKIPDLRALIHWQPILKTDDSGMATISFYNADVTGDMLVVVEAITDNGAIGYQEFTYKVDAE